MVRVDDLERLVAIEEISILKARFWCGVDAKDFEWRIVSVYGTSSPERPFGRPVKSMALA